RRSSCRAAKTSPRESGPTRRRRCAACIPSGPERPARAPAVPSSIPQRLAGFQRVLNPLERLPFAAQLQKRLPLQIEQVLFADGRLMGQRAASENIGERASDDGVVIADAAGAPREVDTQLERGPEALATYQYARRGHWPLIAFTHALEGQLLGVRQEPLTIHRRAIGAVEKSETPRVRGAGRDLGEPNRFEDWLNERQQVRRGLGHPVD